MTAPRLLLAAAACLLPATAAPVQTTPVQTTPAQTTAAPTTPVRAEPAWPADGVARLVSAAVAQTGHAVRYDGAYRRIAYPMGDVPADIGVCSDVVIRAYRAVGIDLQQRVHEDMRAAFAAYPHAWGLSQPDPNIDHRRVPNLQVFFRRRGAALPASSDGADYRAGDVVTWLLPGNLPHVGLIIDRRSRDGRRPLVVHNIGRGPEIEDALFAFPITGHYRFRGD